MPDDQVRSAIRDAAKYLRSVRPIDPAEIHEYAQSRPDPAEVREILREAAVDLAIRERADGTFVPVADDPVAPPDSPITRLPDRWTAWLRDELEAALGEDWATGDTGDRLRARIREVKAQYLAGDAVTYDRLTALGYAVYHLPQTYAAMHHELRALAADGRLPRRLRVLDVGAGVGGPALALVDLLAETGVLEYHAVEPGAGADLLASALETLDRNVTATVHRDPIEAGPPSGPFDLIVCANVFSELADPVAVGSRLLDHLDPSGTLLAISPADRETATGLRTVERSLEDAADATVYAPTVRLWPHRTPASRCWSFTRRPDLAVPGVQAELDAAGAGDGEFVNVDVQYAPALLRRDDATRVVFRPAADRYAPMASMDEHVTERIDCVGVKLSPNLADEGANPLFLVGDGSEQVDHVAVRVGASTLNRDLVDADYGDVCRFENVLVLWNEDEGAYNLVVEQETVVDRVAP